MSNEIDPIVASQVLTLGSGTIEPALHIANGEYDWRLVDGAERMLVYDQSLRRQVLINYPVQCADGRTEWVVGGSAIGGSFTGVMADMLGPRLFAKDSDSASDYAKVVYTFLKANKLPVGGHDDEHANPTNCGCGGEDKLALNLEFVANYGEQIRDFLQSLKSTTSGKSLGIQIDDQTHDLIINNAKQIDTDSFCSSGQELRKVMSEIGGSENIETLRGTHKEAFAVLDFRDDNYALDRNEFTRRTNGLLQSFFIKVSSVKALTYAMYKDRSQSDLAFASALYFNVATTAVLCGPSLRVVTLV